MTEIAYTLHDYLTGERLGTATPAQVEASLAADDEGVIMIDADGNVITPGTWAAQQPGTRSVYVA